MREDQTKSPPNPSANHFEDHFATSASLYTSSRFIRKYVFAIVFQIVRGP